MATRTLQSYVEDVTMKNNSFAWFTRAFFIFKHFADVLVVSTTWNGLFCSCVEDVRMWWQLLNFASLFLKRWGFSKDPATYRARKAILETMIRWPWKPALLLCFRYKGRQTNCQVSKIGTWSYWRCKGIYATPKVLGHSRNRPLVPVLFKNN